MAHSKKYKQYQKEQKKKGLMPNKSPKKRKASKKKKQIIAILCIILALFLVNSVRYLIKMQAAKKDPINSNNFGNINQEQADKPKYDENGEIIKTKTEIFVSVIDVGQGESVFVNSKDAKVLIDGGESSYGNKVSKYIASDLNGQKLDYVINTTPSPEHCGGLPQIYKDFKVKKTIYGSKSKDASFKTFMATAKKEKGNKIEVGKKQNIDLGDGAVLTVHNFKTKDKSNAMFCTIVHENNTIVIAGDASKEDELKMRGLFDSVTVFVLSNHGGTGAACNEILREWSPEYAIISSLSPSKNDGQFPAKETIERLDKEYIDTFSTYHNGNIKFKIDGNEVTFNIDTEKSIDMKNFTK